MEHGMKFTGVDTQFNDDVLDGECDGDHNIVKLRVTNSAYAIMIKRAESRRGAPIETLEELSKALPRLEIGWDNDEVEKEEETFRGRVVKLNPERQQVFGWAYVTHDPTGEIVVDRSGEFVEDVAVLEKAAYDFVTSSRRGGADHSRHADRDEVIVKSTMIESIVFTPDKIKEMGIPSGTIPQGAWWVGFQIHDADIWKSYREGRRTSFSIHGRGVKAKV